MRRPFSYMSSHNHPPPYAHGGNPYPMSPYASYPPYPAYSYAAYPSYPSYPPHPVTPGSNPGSPHYHYHDSIQFNRKRQRRQAAGVVVQSLFSNNMGRKSTAQPRPVLHVPPGGIGPIAEPNENDVLSGRGGRINSHPGNVRFREIIAANKKEYLAPSTKKLEKAHIAASLVNDIRSMDPPGRFLKEDPDTGLWWDIGDAKAIKKTGQALREDAPEIRPDIDGGSSGDEDGETDGKKSPKSVPKPKVPAATKKSPPKPQKQPVSPKSSQPLQQQTQGEQPITSAQIPLPPPPQPPFQQGMMAGPQYVPGPGVWPQQSAMMNPMDYQAQMSMPPPPYAQQMNPAYVQQQMHMQNSFQVGGNIAMQQQHPNMGRGFVQGVSSIPNQLYSGARSVTGKVASVSKQAMEVLAQTGQLPNSRSQTQKMQDEAFGRTFHPPAVLSSDNTMSEISGLSDPLSGLSGAESGARGSALSGTGRGSALSGQQQGSMMSVLSSGTSKSPTRGTRNQRTSLRLSQIGRAGLMNAAGGLGSSRMSDLTASVRSTGSLSRSFSFPDMSSVAENDAWQAIVEGDEDGGAHDDGLTAMENASFLSGHSGRASFTSGRMSLMSFASGTSSSRWMAALGDSALMDDAKSYMSEMSSDLNALDLASDKNF